MAINNIFTPPGVFTQFQPVRRFPITPGGARVVALIGKGRETNQVFGETVTKGSIDGSDSLNNTAVSLSDTVVDEDQNTYNLGEDYQLTSGEVDWSLSSPAFITGTESEPFDMSSSQTLKLTVADANSGNEQVVDISDVGAGSGSYASPAAATAAEVASVIQANFSGITASDDSGKVKISTLTANNTSLLVGDGNANSTLGFTDGSFQETPREPVAGKTYQVSYEYAKASSDYVPRFFFDLASVTAEHGEVSTSNTLSLGAELVFQQGASVVALVQTDPADGAEVNQFRKALEKLEAVDGINIVVPLTTNTVLHSDVKNHVINMSATTERKERTAILAMPDPQTVQSLAAQANALSNKRLVLINSTKATKIVGNNTTASTLDGSFVAAAIAGIRTSATFDVADPLTRKEITGFQDIPNALLRSEKTFLLSQGVLVVENISGILRIQQGITTDTSTRENNEYSVVEIIDFVASNMRRVLEEIYIGQKILENTPSQVRTTVQAFLNNLVTSEIIVASQNVQAAIDGSDPTQINVAFEIAPVFPLNFILVTFSLSPNQ